MSIIKETKNKINELIEKANAEPTLENLLAIECEMDFYSDIYKDEYGCRPSLYFRDSYSEELQKVSDDFFNMPNHWEIYDKFIRGEEI